MCGDGSGDRSEGVAGGGKRLRFDAIRLTPHALRDYKKYGVWKEGHQFVLKIYRITEKFPRNEQFRLIDQMCRASASVPTNIVEGCGRETDNEFKRFLVIARGSANEMEYHLLLAKDLGYITNDEYEALFDDVNKLVRSLNNLIKKL